MTEDTYNWVVYGICCALSGRVHYVGVTCNFKSRRKDHRREAKSGNKSRLYAWMREAEEFGWKPDFRILEEGSGYESAGLAERRWIAMFADSGELFNQRPGGEFLDSLDAYKATRSAEARAKGRAVICLTTGERFESVAACARVLGVDESRVFQSCKTGYRCLGRALAYADDPAGGQVAHSRRRYAPRGHPVGTS
jgi:hypothetical protein